MGRGTKTRRPLIRQRNVGLRQKSRGLQPARPPENSMPSRCEQPRGLKSAAPQTGQIAVKLTCLATRLWYARSTLRANAAGVAGEVVAAGSAMPGFVVMAGEPEEVVGYKE